MNNFSNTLQSCISKNFGGRKFDVLQYSKPPNLIWFPHPHSLPITNIPNFSYHLRLKLRQILMNLYAQVRNEQIYRQQNLDTYHTLLNKDTMNCFFRAKDKHMETLAKPFYYSPVLKLSEMTGPHS